MLAKRLICGGFLALTLVSVDSLAEQSSLTASGRVDSTTLISLAAHLDADGYLRLPAEFSGGLDPRGYQLADSSAQGLRFVPNGASTAKLFGAPDGCNGRVWALARAATGLIYLGGEFSACEDVQASSIVAYDPSSRRFRSLGSGSSNGINGIVYALSTRGAELYVGGSFFEAGGVAARNIARWDGSAWSTLEEQGFSLDSIVYAIATSANLIYAGGRFELAGNRPASHVAAWDGERWMALGQGAQQGVDDEVYALSIDDDGSLVVGGAFTAAGGSAANRIARWDGQRWASVGVSAENGLSGEVTAILAVDGQLYVGGRFDSAGSTSASLIARWDGSAWHSLGSGIAHSVAPAPIPGVTSLAWRNGLLYAAGFFDRAGSVRALSLAAWNGTDWARLGEGISNDGSFPSAHAVLASPEGIYAGGVFQKAGDLFAANVALWNGTGWATVGQGVGQGVNGDVRAIAVLGSDIYVGGTMTRAADIEVNGIARWNGSRWFALGTPAANGVDGFVDTLSTDGQLLYVGGLFSNAGDVQAENVAQWDGQSWSALGPGLSDGSVLVMLSNAGQLFVGGSFGRAGDIETNGVARWDGAQWHALDGGVEGGAVFALAFLNGDLYAGGGFRIAGGSDANRVARWDGLSWFALGSESENGTDNTVTALAIFGGQLFVGGSFSDAGTTDARRIARWDGSDWFSLASGLNGGRVRSMVANEQALFVAGDFAQADGMPANGLAIWDGSSWTGLLNELPRRQSIDEMVLAGDTLVYNGIGLVQTPLPDLLSVAADGTAANGSGSAAVVSRFGVRSAFVSNASNLTADDQLGRSDVFVRDRGSDTITRASAVIEALNGTAEDFFEPSISPTGGSVAFAGSSGQVYSSSGGLGRTASSSAAGEPGNGSSGAPMAADDNRVWFQTEATNLLDGIDGNGSVSDIVLKNLQTGAVTLWSQSPSGEPANGPSFAPWASVDGTAVAYSTLATNLSDEARGASAAGKGAVQQAILSSVGGLGRSGSYLSRNLSTGELGNGDSTNVRLSADGRYGVFESLASNLVVGDSNGVKDVFMFETDGRRLISLRRVSVSRIGAQANGPSRNASITDDGAYVSFESDADNLVELDLNGVSDVFVYATGSGDIIRLSGSVDGEPPNGASGQPSISADGSTIVFDSAANNLAANDNNGLRDVFAVDLQGSTANAAFGAELNYSYTYWNPAEPGWGLNLQHQGDLLYGTWYSYAPDDGLVMFLTVEATLNADGSFSGPVYRVAGTPFDQINGMQAFTAIEQIGTASMVFAGDGELSFSYQLFGVSQTRQLERFVFSSDPPVCFGTTASRLPASNYSDLWWNPSEAGWGLTLAHQGEAIFLLWYTYGVGGRDQWVSASQLLRQPDGSFAGALQRPLSGVPLPDISGPATTFPVPQAGTATLRFSDGETGVFSYALDGVTQSKAIQRFVVVGADQAKPLCAD